MFPKFPNTPAFHIETSHLFCRAKQITGFYMKRNTGLKWVNIQSSCFQKKLRAGSLTTKFCSSGAHAIMVGKAGGEYSV